MTRLRMPRGVAPVLGALVALACADPAEAPREEAPPRQEAAGDAAGPPGAGAAAPASAATRMALPGLFSIMAGLEGGMARLDRGLWEAGFDTIAAGAEQVSGHPPIPPGEAERIASVLGPGMRRFQELDRTVHDLAVRAEQAARRGDLDAVLGAVNAVRDGCVTCHAEFRARLREALR